MALSRNHTTSLMESVTRSFTFLATLAKKLQNLNIEADYGELDLVFSDDAVSVFSSGRRNPIDLKAIRIKALGKNTTEEDKLGVFILIFFYTMSGPRKPVLNASTPKMENLQIMVTNTEARLNIRYKGDQVDRNDITPQRLLAALPEIAVLTQLKQPESTQIVKSTALLYPYFHPHLVSILPDKPSIIQVAYSLWACARTSATLQRNPGASDATQISLMKAQLTYFKLSFKSDLVPEGMKARTFRKIGGDEMIFSDESFIKFYTDNQKEVLAIVNEVRTITDSEISTLNEGH